MTRNEQISFEVTEADNTPVVCLGMTFESEEARREYFREELRKKLPELKQIEGFPIGKDEDIIALSDPPYYTACPNPWINEFIEEWEKEKITKYGRDLNAGYDREPFASDVSEGKNDAIYNAHSYHTKVPFKAIMRYLIHYTEPGDIIYDGFSGTGMTGVATQMCDNETTFKELGYLVDGENVISDGKIITKLGKRNVILNDLSPAATFTTYNYNTKISLDEYKQKAERLLNEVISECEWLFKTNHTVEGEIQLDKDGNEIIGDVNYIVYSDVFECDNCSHEFVFWDVAVDEENGKVLDEFNCPSCQAKLTKRNINRSIKSVYDTRLKEIVNQAKQQPVMINYSVNNKRHEKKPDLKDKELLKKILELDIPYWYPSDELPKGYNTEQPIKSHGFTHVHHFHVKQNLYVFAKIAELAKNDPILFSLIGDMLPRASKMHKIAVSRLNTNLSKTAGILSGTLYIPSNSIAYSALEMLKFRVKDIINYLEKVHHVDNSNIISTQSSTNIKQISDCSVDYIFTDPPFGANLMYSELNAIWESWLKVKTNNKSEAIMNQVQDKNILDYQTLMYEAFYEYYRVLKPNRWITVEFSNSQASIWNAIQEAMQRAGFIVANVAALDKKQGSFKAVTSTTAVKQDLVISAYKPSDESIKKMRELTNTPESAWTFVTQHLEKLPVFLGTKGEAQVIAERTPRILFDRMVAYHVQNGLPVPISSAEFQAGVAQRFPMRDGMAFLESQVAEYDKKRTLVKEFTQMSLFVSDENSSIEWIRQQLMKKPQTRQDLHPQFMKEIQHIAKHEQLPELDDLLAQNFLRYEGEETVPDQIASYLRRNFHDMRGLENTDGKLRAKAMNRWYVPDPNKQADLEKLREKTLLREFDHYVEELGNSKKKLKQFRTEAIRAGFKKAWSEKNYEKIVTVGDRLPEQVIQEDDKLLMYYDNAQVRLDM
ncbi:DNA methylase [Niallia circulans]|jgi:DNA modification methylase|uniref:DNA methyltransferase n=1 Tax=Niallia circulans TaxID=1397 RepID=UPI000BA65DBA|nr:DNA methyltransferase [Niallia circulans]PAD23516.1 DNA methylase [Niallia circulans]